MTASNDNAAEIWSSVPEPATSNSQRSFIPSHDIERRRHTEELQSILHEEKSLEIITPNIAIQKGIRHEAMQLQWKAVLEQEACLRVRVSKHCARTWTSRIGRRNVAAADCSTCAGCGYMTEVNDILRGPPRQYVVPCSTCSPSSSQLGCMACCDNSRVGRTWDTERSATQGPCYQCTVQPHPDWILQRPGQLWAELLHIEAPIQDVEVIKIIETQGRLDALRARRGHIRDRTKELDEIAAFNGARERRLWI